MKLHMGVWLPDHERHLCDWMSKVNRIVDGRGSYQFHKLEVALEYVRDWRTAVDVGAHCGLISMHLAPRFDRLWAFEPIAEHRECFAANLPDAVNVELEPVALGEHAGFVGLRTGPGSSGDTAVDPSVAATIPLKTLDSYDLADVDFMKLDCEGYELFALKGAEQTIRRCKPAIIVEQKPGRADAFGLPTTGAVEWLKGLGYTLRREMSGDFIMSV